MSSITNFFERRLRNENQNPPSRWPQIACGFVFLLAGAIVQLRHQDGLRVAAWVVEGFGMISYGVTEAKFRSSKLYVPSLVLSLALWFGGVFLILRAYM
jgi:hypothetical protein